MARRDYSEDLLIQAPTAELLEQIKLYDAPELQASFVQISPDNQHEAALILEGITCAACIWLINSAVHTNPQNLPRNSFVLTLDITQCQLAVRQPPILAILDPE